MGLLSGILAGFVVNIFRFVLETPFPMLGISNNPDDFESLPGIMHFLLPVGGSMVIALILNITGEDNLHMGVTHVIEKVQNLKSSMPARNAVLQFICGALALLSGQSCGREGPAIHLGATSSSYLGQLFQLPHNANRIMIACGSAGAISASFNTPMAGVIFTMEVVMMEYSISGFIPVITAAVSGAVITQSLHGDSPVFLIPDMSMTTLWEIPYVILMGIVIGTLAAAFIAIQKYCLSFSSIDLRKRLIFAGLLTGGIAIFVPQIMGTGYDTLNEALQSNLGMSFLLLLLVAKLVITPITLGLGMPGGVIGPTIMIGGIAGAIMGNLGAMAASGFDANPSFYVLLGMCAMMGAVLQAPLAALMALLELSGNPNVILPAMLIIVVANLTSKEVFGFPSIFQVNLHQLGIKTPKTLSRLLNRYGVSSIMNTRIQTVKLSSPPADFSRLLEGEPQWIVLDNAEDIKALVRPEVLAGLAPGSELKTDSLESKPLAPISLHATLQEAMEILQEANLKYGYVYSPIGIGKSAVLGIISIDDIIDFYRDR